MKGKTVLSSKIKFETIDQYVKSYPKDIQKKLQEVRRTINKAAPAADEAISYQIPTFKLDGNLVHFAAFKNHIGFYPGSEALKVFKKLLLSYKTSRGTVQFPLDKPIPLSLIKKIVDYRVKASSQRTKQNK